MATIKELIEQGKPVPDWLRNVDTIDEDVSINEDGRVIWHSGTWCAGVWESGTWECGVWKNGIWQNGRWLDGVWRGGVWERGTWVDGVWEKGVWYWGCWQNGVWKSGTWWDGTWLGGLWKYGLWKYGFWYDGTWEDGTWQKGVWHEGKWIGGEQGIRTPYSSITQTRKGTIVIDYMEKTREEWVEFFDHSEEGFYSTPRNYEVFKNIRAQFYGFCTYLDMMQVD